MKRLAGRSSSRLAFAVSLMLLFYLSYRYPLQINFSGTSQVYSDTPLVLQLLKFVGALAGCGLLFWIGRPSAIGRGAAPYLGALGVLVSVCIAKTLISGDGGFIDSALWTLVGLFLAVHIDPTSARVANKCIAWLLYVSFAIDAIQVLLFFTTGRLPALAWEGSLSIRFGSFLDDPNGFSVLCFLFLGWAWMAPSTSSRWLHSILVIVMLLAGQSLTAVGLLLILAVAAIVALVMKLRGNALLAAGVALLALGVLMLPLMANLISSLQEFKQGSIDQHASFDYADLVDRTVPEFLLGAFSYRFFESWWLQAYFNFGIPWTLAQLGLAVYSFYVCLRRASTADAEMRRVHAGLATFIFAFNFSALNLPLYTVFPVNFVYQLVCAYVILGRIRPDQERLDARVV